jgi:hypothetical protein
LAPPWANWSRLPLLKRIHHDHVRRWLHNDSCQYPTTVDRCLADMKADAFSLCDWCLTRRVWLRWDGKWKQIGKTIQNGGQKIGIRWDCEWWTIIQPSNRRRRRRRNERPSISIFDITFVTWTPEYTVTVNIQCTNDWMINGEIGRKKVPKTQKKIQCAPKVIVFLLRPHCCRNENSTPYLW